MYSLGLEIGRNQMYTILTLEFRLFLRTHLSYRKNSRTHSTPVRSTKLLSVLTSEYTLDALVSQLYSLHANLMQGSNSSIFDGLCTHFRFKKQANRTHYSSGGIKMCSLQNMVIFVPPWLISNTESSAHLPWRAPPLLLLRRAAQLLPRRFRYLAHGCVLTWNAWCTNNCTLTWNTWCTENLLTYLDLPGAQLRTDVLTLDMVPHGCTHLRVEILGAARMYSLEILGARKIVLT